MQDLVYAAVVGLAILLSLKALGVIAMTLLPLFILAMVLFLPLAFVMGLGWVTLRILGGFRRPGRAEG
jgi:hypothetical protein